MAKTRLLRVFILDRPTRSGRIIQAALMLFLLALPLVSIGLRQPISTTAWLAGLAAFCLLFIVFLDGLPSVGLAAISLVLAIATYYLLDKAILGDAADIFTKTIQKSALAFGSIFAGALTGALLGHRILANEKTITYRRHRYLRIGCGVFAFIGIGLLVWEVSLLADVGGVSILWTPVLHAAAEFFMALGIGLFVESRSFVAKLISGKDY